MKEIYLGVNIDHVATVRNARGGTYPDPVTAAAVAEMAGADGITTHLREDRRHITDRDVRIIRETVQTKLNLEMAVTDDILGIAAALAPQAACFVPERRQEITTEGGLDVVGEMNKIDAAIRKLEKVGTKVSLFIDPVKEQIDAALKVGAPYVEFHTGFILSGIFSVMMIWLYTKVRPQDIWDKVKTAKVDIIPGITGKNQHLSLCRHCSFVYDSRSYKKCPRCGHISQIRNYDCYQKAAALLLSAIILYFPSNLYPIMFTSYLGNETGSNILEGVVTLWQMDSYFVAGVIFLASICIPVLKIIALIILMIIVKYRRPQRPNLLSKFYRIVAFIGKWSMIDVFVVIIMTSVVRFSGVMTIDPGFAIITFCLVVIITMFAAEEFDERLIWDPINERRKESR